MRVLHLRSPTGMYGAEQLLLGLVREQARRGRDARIVAFAPVGRPRPELLAAASTAGLAFDALPCRGPIDASAVLRLRRMLAADRGIDVVHCHDYKSVVYTALAAVDSSVARVATLHGWVRTDARLRFYRWLELRALRGFDRVCAVSPVIESELVAAGVDEARVVRVDNGVDSERFRPAPPAVQSDDGAVHLGCAARLSPEKNLAQLILAVAECRARGRLLRLTLHGDGPQRDELDRLVTRLGLQRVVQMPGATSHLEAWYPALDAFVLPSLTEGMPMTVLEALSCGCPVVGSAVGAIPELLSGLPGCQLVPAGDQEALVDALMAVPRRSEPRLAARERIVAGYSVTQMAARYDEVYRDAVQHRSRAPLPPAAASPPQRRRRPASRVEAPRA